MGGASLIWTEFNLIKKAISVNSYQYYHLLSGQDLPIKSQDYIHHFFSINDGKEFVRYNHSDFQYKDRVSVYHLFQEMLGRKWQNIFNRIFLKAQYIVGIKRNKGVSFYKGTQWFSITDNFAKYTISNEKWIRTVFKHTFCCDEVFLQTLLMKSPYKDNRYWMPMDNDPHAIMRLIDWNRGTPYTYRISDLDELKASDMLFCRKFDSVVDSLVIEAVKDFVKAE